LFPTCIVIFQVKRNATHMFSYFPGIIFDNRHQSIPLILKWKSPIFTIQLSHMFNFQPTIRKSDRKGHPTIKTKHVWAFEWVQGCLLAFSRISKVSI
jgi:hypothetical protein